MGDVFELEELQWSDKLHQDLYNMMVEKRFCDTEIHTGDGQVLKAHANVLAARSQLLHNSFNLSSSPSFQLNTEEISSSLWESILRFMYLGKVTIESASIQDLFDAAEILEMAQLQDLCKCHLDQIQAETIAVKQENLTSMETQTEEEIMKFASGEKSTLYGYGECETDTNLEVDASGAYTNMTDPNISVQSLSYNVNELVPQIPDQGETLYIMETNEEEKPYVTVATASVQNPDGSGEPQPVISISKNSTSANSNQSSDAIKSRRSSGRILNKDMLFKCGICNKFYSSKQALERHAVLHTDKRAYTCEVCGKSFKLERYLQAHVERHKTERNFQCPICGKGFKTQRDASWHQKTVHTSDKKYPCPHCSYAGKTKNLLNQHMFSHTEEKQFKCELCGKLFLRKQHLEQHAERHEGKKKFMCSTCGAEFYTVYACKEHHMRIHQGLKKYECSVCGQQYNEKKSFMKHLQKHSVDLVLKLEGDIVVEQTVEEEAIVGEAYAEVETSTMSVDNISSDPQYTVLQVQSNEGSTQDVQLHYVQEGAIIEGHYIEGTVGQ